MHILISALNPTHIWGYFILLQVALIFATKRYNLSRELFVPYEIVLNSSALLFLLNSIPGEIFLTITCTVASLASSLYLYIFAECKFKKYDCF
jgi:hypothetical protein